MKWNLYDALTTALGNLTFLVRDDGEALEENQIKTLSLNKLGTLMDWIPVSDTWAYASATTITIPTDGTTLYRKGGKVRFKQGGAYKYFSVKSVTATLLTVFAGSDYSVANAAITDIAYSYASEPIGFPKSFNWTPGFSGFSLGNGTMVARATVDDGGWVDYTIEINFGSTTSISGTVDHNLPITPVTQTSTFLAIGAAVFHDYATAIYYGASVIQGGSLSVRVVNAAGTYAIWATISATVPFTWGTSDQLILNGRYEAA